MEDTRRIPPRAYDIALGICSSREGEGTSRKVDGDIGAVVEQVSIGRFTGSIGPDDRPAGLTVLAWLLVAPGGLKAVNSPCLETVKLWKGLAAQAGSVPEKSRHLTRRVTTRKLRTGGSGKINVCPLSPLSTKPWLTPLASRYPPTMVPCGVMKLGVVAVEPGGSNGVEVAMLVQGKAMRNPGRVGEAPDARPLRLGPPLRVVVAAPG